MDPEYKESRSILPRNLTILLTVMLVVAWISILVTRQFYYSGIPMIALTVCGVIFAAAIILCFVMRFDITVYEDRVEIFYIYKTTTIPKEQIIDTRVGELNRIKNYSDWNLKGVKYSTSSAVGEEMGLGLKVTGKRVFYLSSKDPEAIAALLPKKEA